MIALLFSFAIIYERGLKKYDHIHQQLTEQWLSLQEQKNEALRHQQNLKSQISSQSDLAWVELTLIKGLGLLPEGQKKVYFYQDHP